MESFHFLFLFLVLFSCKNAEEKIVFDFPKDTKMKFEEFNEGEAQMGSSAIYLNFNH